MNERRKLKDLLIESMDYRIGYVSKDIDNYEKLSENLSYLSKYMLNRNRTFIIKTGIVDRKNNNIYFMGPVDLKEDMGLIAKNQKISYKELEPKSFFSRYLSEMKADKNIIKKLDDDYTRLFGFYYRKDYTYFKILMTALKDDKKREIAGFEIY